VGWYMMALVDTLPYYAEGDPGRATLLEILNRTAAAVIRYQDRKTGLWYQVLDKPNAPGNYLESSAACMFAYALAKGVRLGYLPLHYSANAEHAWQEIQRRFLQADASGSINFTGTARSTESGGNQHDVGSYTYYVSSPVVSNGPVGIGVFLLAASEMELGSDATLGLGKTALLDAWYNSQKRQNAAGQTEYFHYKWSDYSNPGLSLFGNVLRSYGIATDTLYTAPTLKQLKGAKFYIIVSPDNPAKNPDPHYMTSEDAKQIAAWVKDGGVLLMFENDPDNADISHLDLLADEFGLHFNNALTHHVIDNDIQMGRIRLDVAAEPFTSKHVLFMKDTCSLALTKGAVPLLSYKGDILMAKAKYGKGTVLAVADPWLYNEYTDGRILPAEYDNFAAGKELVRWLLQQP
jgi:unsaturated rhamnogalacturonyl hydrolase